MSRILLAAFFLSTVVHIASAGGKEAVPKEPTITVIAEASSSWLVVKRCNFYPMLRYEPKKLVAKLKDQGRNFWNLFFSAYPKLQDGRLPVELSININNKVRVNETLAVENPKAADGGLYFRRVSVAHICHYGTNNNAFVSEVKRTGKGVSLEIFYECDPLDPKNRFEKGTKVDPFADENGSFDSKAPPKEIAATSKEQHKVQPRAYDKIFNRATGAAWTPEQMEQDPELDNDDDDDKDNDDLDEDYVEDTIEETKKTIEAGVKLI